MIEFLFSTGLIALTVSGAGWLLHAQWERGKCAYLVFEATHARLTGEVGTPGTSGVLILELPGKVSGTGHCGSAEEAVTLPRLETFR